MDPRPPGRAVALAGRHGETRGGRPPTHTADVRSRLIAQVVQQPPSLGHPVARWTLERLQCAFEAAHQVHLSDRTIWTWLQDEGLVWDSQQTWFHEPHRHDPEFAVKEGASSRRTSRRRTPAG